jgi:exopolysaccharide biosynthesis polyprenyl glycosylphosphotransferase
MNAPGAAKTDTGANGRPAEEAVHPKGGGAVEAPKPSRFQPARLRTFELDWPIQVGAALTTRDSVRRWALALADVVALAAAYGVVLLAASPVSGFRPVAVAAILPAWVALNKVLGLYDRDASLIHKSTLDELPGLAQSLAFGIGLLLLLAPVLPVPEMNRGEIAIFLAAAAVLVPCSRAFARTLVRRTYAPERCVIIGSGLVARLVARKIAAHSEFGVEVLGLVDVPSPDREPDDSDIRHLGSLDEFEEICRRHQIERVVIAFSSLSHEALLDVIRKSKNLDMKITVVPRLFEVIGHAVEIDQLEGMTLMGLRGLSRTRSSLALKRAIDVAGATAGLVLLSPVLLAIALAVKLTSRGPMLFKQHRIGKGNQPFLMLKFRTMVDGAEELKESLMHLNEADGPMFKIADDPRITRVGRLLRRTSLDELPQLWNVLRGEMSLVGPRPLVPSENDHVIGWHRARLELTPGLTGPWQVLGRTAIPFQEMVKLDYLYVSDWSLWNDVKLLIQTAPVVMRRRGH